jgi:rhodanese-related sulfurtransferase
MKQHTAHFLTLVTEAKKHILEITPQALKQRMDAHDPLTLIDVRETEEFASGFIANALHLSKGVIERDIEKVIPDTSTPIVVYCSGGFRSALVAQNLTAMGYTQVSSLDTGLRGWLEAQYPIESS